MSTETKAMLWLVVLPGSVTLAYQVLVELATR